MPQTPPRVGFGPLDGVRVLDLSRLLPGPYASLVLSDLGADVVKVEDPEHGDYLRQISAGMFAALNRGKRSIVLDLKTSSDAAELRRLCAVTDVLIESFRPGVLERLGVADLLADPGRLVICRISRYGQSGPWGDRAGHDIGDVALAGDGARNGGGPGGRRAWADRGFDRALVPEVDALLATRTREEWDVFLCSADCCGAPVLEPFELRDHPLFAGLFAGDLPRTYPALVVTADLPAGRAPASGEHTEEVLREWSSR